VPRGMPPRRPAAPRAGPRSAGAAPREVVDAVAERVRRLPGKMDKVVTRDQSGQQVAGRVSDRAGRGGDVVEHPHRPLDRLQQAGALAAHDPSLRPGPGVREGR
jgi:hypothetical protein